MEMACEQEEGCLCLTKKKKKERLNFFVQTQGTVRQGKRETHAPGREFWFPTFQAGKSRWNWHSTMRQTLSLFFFPFFFSFFVLWAGSLASKDNFPWTPCANCAVFLLESVYKTK